jgi:hypothetical protein
VASRGRGARPALGDAGFAGVLVLVIGLACSGASPEREANLPRHDRVLRADHVGCGYDRDHAA